jgi:CIC family chloride channel protein
MIIWILAVLVGFLAGAAVPFSWWLLQRAGDWVGKMDGDSWPLHLVIAFPLGTATIIVLLMLGFRGFRSADGFTYFISDLHFQDGRRKGRYSFVHSLANLVFVLGQAISGIEGFCMEALSTFGSWLGQETKLSANQIRTLAGCGATASIAAVLGQPMTAFIFVVELLYGWGTSSFAVGMFALAAFTAASVSQSLSNGILRTGMEPDAGLSMVLQAESFYLSPFAALLCVVGFSLLCGLLAALSISVHRRTDQELHGLFVEKKGVDLSPGPFTVRILLWAILTAVVMYKFPLVLGTGELLLNEALAQGTLFHYIGLAFLLRVFMGAVSYSVLGGMGLVLPTLIGGCLIGAGVYSLAPGFLDLSGGTLALLAMGGFFSASFGTPVAATALVFSYSSGMMTDNALFLMSAILINFFSHFLCGKLQTDRIATMGLYRHGIRFRNGMCYNTLSSIQVRDAMITYLNPVSYRSSMGEAYRKLMSSKFSLLPVVTEEGKLKGMLSLADFYGLDTWKKLGEDSQVHSLVGVEELVKPDRVRLKPDMNLETALEKMSDEEMAPVCESDGQYVGLLVKSDLVNLYNKEVVKKAFRRI